MGNKSVNLSIGYLAFFLFLIAPEYNSPIGRLGGEVLIFLFILPLILQSLQVKDCWTLAPIWLGILSVILTWISTFQENSHILLMDGLTPTLSYSRNVFFAALGLYLGKNLKPHEIQPLAKFCFYCALFVTLFAIGQANSQFIRETTLKIFSATDELYHFEEEQLFRMMRERPESSLGRTWAYSYFAAVIFLCSISIIGILKSKLYVFFSVVIFLIGLIYSGTKSAVLAVIAGLILLFFMNTSVLEKQKRYLIKFIVVTVAFLIPLVLYFYGFDRLDWFYNPFIIGLSGAAEDVQYSSSYLSRIIYIERQIELFKYYPFFGILSSVKFGYTDNFYVSRLAYGGIIGLFCSLLIPIIFFWLYKKYKQLSIVIENIEGHLFFSNLLFWAAFCGLVMGVAWDFFVGNRTISFFLFIFGLLSGQLNYFQKQSVINK
jgi:hypothetical protein